MMCGYCTLNNGRSFASDSDVEDQDYMMTVLHAMHYSIVGGALTA